MTIGQLTYLTTVLQCGINLSSAARMLGVSQPNISKQLALLEEEVGAPLFERTGKRLTALTPVGRKIYHHAVAVTEQLNQLQTDIDSMDPDKSIVLGLTPFTHEHVLPGMLAAISHEVGDLSIDLELMPCEQIAQGTLEGRCDMGLVVGEVAPDPGLLIVPWYRWRYRVIFSRTNGLAKRLRADRRLMRELPIAACASLTAPSAEIPRALAQLGISNRIDMIMPNPNDVKNVVRANGHIGLIAEMAYSEEEDMELDSCESPAPLPTMMAWIVIRKKALAEARVQRMLHAIAPQLHEDSISAFLQLQSRSEFFQATSKVKVPRYG